jgi:hypothetical protein
VSERPPNLAEKFFSDVLDEAERLGLKWWEKLALTLAVALLAVVLRYGGEAAQKLLKSIVWKLEPAPEWTTSDGGPSGPGVALETGEPDKSGGSG